MKVTSYAVSRPAYYDRDATASQGSYDAGLVAPHAFTTRITTTVAAGKKMLVEVLFLSFRRQVAAGTSSSVTLASYAITGLGTAVMPRVDGVATTVGLMFSVQASDFTLFGAERLDIYSEDQSTGGSMLFSAGFKGVTFNA